MPPRGMTAAEKKKAKAKADKAAYLAKEEAAGWPNSKRDEHGNIEPGEPGFEFSKDRMVMMRQLAKLQAKESYKPPTERDIARKARLEQMKREAREREEMAVEEAAGEQRPCGSPTLHSPPAPSAAGHGPPRHARTDSWPPPRPHGRLP